MQARERRDRLVRELRAEDPQQWTYRALAQAVGCSVTVITRIIDPAHTL